MDELRRASVMFVKLSNIGYSENVDKNCAIINEIVVFMQKEIFRQEGMILQVFEDEEGDVAAGELWTASVIAWR